VFPHFSSRSLVLLNNEKNNRLFSHLMPELLLTNPSVNRRILSHLGVNPPMHTPHFATKPNFLLIHPTQSTNTNKESTTFPFPIRITLNNDSATSPPRQPRQMSRINSQSPEISKETAFPSSSHKTSPSRIHRSSLSSNLTKSLSTSHDRFVGG
jgi:hypothetical protein